MNDLTWDGVREIWAFFAKLETSEGWREEEQVIFDENLWHCNNLCWIGKLKQLPLCHDTFDNDNDVPLSNTLLPIFSPILLTLPYPSLTTSIPLQIPWKSFQFQCSRSRKSKYSSSHVATRQRSKRTKQMLGWLVGLGSNYLCRAVAGQVLVD